MLRSRKREDPNRVECVGVLLAKHPILHLERLAVHHHCLGVLPLRVQDICIINGRHQRVGVLLAEHPLLHFERPVVHHRRFCVLPSLDQCICTDRGRPQRIGVLFAK